MIRVAVYAAMRRLGLRPIILLGVIAAVVLWAADGAQAATCSLYGGSTSGRADGSGGPFSLGTRFEVTGTGASLTSVAFYRRASDTTESRDVKLWANTDLLQTESSAAEEAVAGWVAVAFDPPVALSAAVEYTVSTDYADSKWSRSNTTPPPAACGPVQLLTPLGTYNESPGARPSETVGDHYFVDPTVTYDTEPPPEEEEDASAAELTWWGIWALVGLSFVSMIAPAFLRAFDVRHGLGGRFERG